MLVRNLLRERFANCFLGLREKHLESIIQNTLRHIILVSAHPRTLIQLTLQIVTSPEDKSVTGSLPQAASVGFLRVWTACSI